MSIFKMIRYWYMVLRNAEHYRNMCLRVGNDCLTTVLRVPETKGYEYCHLVVKGRLKLMPVTDVEAEKYVGELFLPGSAETGGEKAVGLKDLVGLLRLPEHSVATVRKLRDQQEALERVEMMIDDDGETWDLSPNDQKALQIVLDLANFHRSSQNQPASSGVEGAHEGTTADKSGSREPEKLNNAHESEKCAKCGEILEHWQHSPEEANPHHFEPAESSLSSHDGEDGKKSGTIYCHACSDAGGAERGIYHLPPECASPELLPTQLPKEDSE